MSNDESGIKIFFQICGSGCEAGTTLNFAIKGGNNPSVTRPPMSSFSIITKTSDNYLMEKKDNGLIALP